MEKQIVMRVLKELLEKILPSDYKVIMNYRFMNGKVGNAKRCNMAKDKVIFKECAFGSGNNRMHQKTIQETCNVIGGKFKTPEGMPGEYLVDQEIDYDKAGLDWGKTRPKGSLLKNYNFDLAIVKADTEDIVGVIEVEANGRGITRYTREKLKNCLEHIPSLQHAWYIEVVGTVSAYSFNFCELVKEQSPILTDNGKSDGYQTIKVDEFLGVPVQAIEMQIRKHFSAQQ